MAPFPEEVDVFTVPHSRMKSLVDVYSRKLTCTDFLDNIAVENLLHELQRTFFEFKSHEYIENTVIMQKLKCKLKDLAIYDSAVCNCHSDNRLSEMLSLVQDGYACRSKPEAERMNYGQKLQSAIREFTDNFLPHMQEEEEVFQPMLMKYFEYDELKTLKDTVIERHQHWEDCVNLTPLDDQLEKFRFEEEDSDNEFCNNKDEETEEAYGHFSGLPPEVILNILSYLSPKDLMSCTKVCRQWRDLAYHPAHWHQLFPIQWARGFWDSRMYFPEEDELFWECRFCEQIAAHCLDEDADVDESELESCRCSRERKILKGLIVHLLPKIGPHVQSITLAGSSTITDDQLKVMLSLCPRVHHLDLSYTKIAGTAFKSFGHTSTIQYLDLTGCSNITDFSLCSLASAWEQKMQQRLYASKCFSHGHVRNEEHVVRTRKHTCSLSDCATSDAFHPRDLLYNGDDICDIEDTHTVNNGTGLWEDNCLEEDFIEFSLNNRVLKQQGLRYLSLSGCFQITDKGLGKLAESSFLAEVQYLDLSGCWLITGPGLHHVIQFCKSLQPDALFYCDRITDGPYKEDANGCQNLGCCVRACCCSGD